MTTESRRCPSLETLEGRRLLSTTTVTLPVSYSPPAGTHALVGGLSHVHKPTPVGIVKIEPEIGIVTVNPTLLPISPSSGPSSPVVTPGNPVPVTSLPTSGPTTH
jgi:hypothetical protein